VHELEREAQKTSEALQIAEQNHNEAYNAVVEAREEMYKLINLLTEKGI
jgi:hypothetical protein